jgi:hypothetical protein
MNGGCALRQSMMRRPDARARRIQPRPESSLSKSFSLLLAHSDAFCQTARFAERGFLQRLARDRIRLVATLGKIPRIAPVRAALRA